MKRILFWSMMMLVVMALPTIVACSSDDDNNDTSNYTEAEIVELLTGKWEIYGEVKVTHYETQTTITDNYKGTIELKNNKSVYFRITDATKQKASYTEYNGKTYEYEYYIEDVLIHDNYKYTILKKNGKNYIFFGGTSNPYPFEIVSLTKTTFLLRLDEEVIDKRNNTKSLGHLYMTMVSN